jgi:para-nitrobenzyl esterase
MSAQSFVRFQPIAAALLGTFLGTLVTAFLGGTAAADTVIATTDAGPVEGLVTPTMTEFLGIPYAEPPVGPQRWQPPQPHAPWSTPRDATAFGSHCPQAFSPFGLDTGTAEDCLFLNVYVPNRKGFAHDARRHRPVMVWIHGGAFSVGESDEYDPTRLVAQNVVVVTINYRLGALGFLAHPALSAESPDHVSGNYGLLDQQLALQWVQHNIRAFGGNPRKVTIFGESAGGLSVHAHMASPLAAGFFQRAIVESGAFFTQPMLADAETQGSAVAAAAGCPDQTAACLRALPVEQIVASQGSDLTSSGPVIDGFVLPQPIPDAFASGEFNRVPVIEGSNHDEFRLFVALLFDLVGGPVTAAEYPDAVATLLGVPPVVAPLIVSHYQLSDYASPDLALSALATDAAFACNAHAAAKLLSRWTKTYDYEFADANAPELFLPPVSFPFGAAHASEIQYLFDVPNVLGAPPLDADQQQLADTMVRYWTRFARSGSPKAAHMAHWPRFRGADSFFGHDDMLSLVAPAPVSANASHFTTDHKCGFWDPLLGN